MLQCNRKYIFVLYGGVFRGDWATLRLSEGEIGRLCEALHAEAGP